MYLCNLCVNIFLAKYLCKREFDEKLHGDLLNYKVKKFAKAKVNFDKWEFEFQIADDEPKINNNTVIF